MRQSTPIDVAARRAQLLEDRGRSGAEVNRRDAAADRLEDALRVRHRELAVVGGIQRADPRVEHLDGVDAGVDLRDQVVGDDGRQARTEPMPGVGVAVHQRLGRAKLFEWPPSIAYDASVKGAPANPISGTRPASSRWISRIASST